VRDKNVFNAYDFIGWSTGANSVYLIHKNLLKKYLESTIKSITNENYF
jgi:hypothetical protein